MLLKETLLQRRGTMLLLERCARIPLRSSFPRSFSSSVSASSSSQLVVRAALYMPASNARAVAKAQTLDADAIILDLEDAVAPAQKEEARDRAIAAAWGRELDFGQRKVVVRVNGVGTEWHDDDVGAIRSAIEANGSESDVSILLPKAESAAQIEDLSSKLQGAANLWCMIETPIGIERAHDIASAAPGQLEAIVMGTVDLANDLGCDPQAPHRRNLSYHLQRVLCAARAAGVAALDGVCTDLEDHDSFLSECAQGRELGFDGKTAIHPKQLAGINDAFTPSEAEADRARAIIAAHSEAEASGAGVTVVDGKLVEALHVRNAERVLRLRSRLDR